MIRPRIYIGEQASSKLRGLQQRTQVTPNLLCRIGLSVSLDDANPVDVALYSDGNAREFQMSTLLGQYQELFVALLRERMAADGQIASSDPNDLLRAHISRGVIQLSNQVRAVEDLVQYVRPVGSLE